MNARPRVFRFVALPPPPAVDMLEVLIEAIEEEFSAAELQAFAKLPLADDPVYRLVRKHVRGGIELVEIARIYGLTRERVRQLESEALTKVRGGLEEWRPE